MRNILMFGGSVFIGKAIAEKFINNGDKVTLINRGNHPCPNGAEQIIADRNDPDKLKAALSGRKFDVVMDGSSYHPDQTKTAVSLLKGSVKHFIHLSTAAVYRDSEIFPYSENSQRGTSIHWGDYSTNKFQCEEILFSEWKDSKFPSTILRPFYVYGPGNNLDRESYVFSRILNHKTIILPSIGMPMIQFGHIDDLCNAIFLISENERCFGKGYNISGDEYITFKGWVEECGKALNIEPKMLLVDTKSTGFKAREWFPFRDINMIGSCDLIKNDCGIQNQYNLLDGLKQTVEKTGLERFKKSLKMSAVEKIILDRNQIEA